MPHRQNTKSPRGGRKARGSGHQRLRTRYQGDDRGSDDKP
jgi:hypothetical protein